MRLRTFVVRSFFRTHLRSLTNIYIIPLRHDKAEQQYRLGIEREAKPFDRLQRRYAEFQRRMAQRVADGVEETTGARRGLSGSTSVTSVDDSVSVSTGLASNTDGPSRERISIYRDDQSALPSENVAAHANARSTSAAWTELGTVKSRNKENSQKAEKWTGATLPQRPSAVTAKPVEKVPVFVEEQVQQVF